MLALGALLFGCASPEKRQQEEVAKREAEARRVQERYASYSTSQLRLKRQQVANSIPSWYYGTGFAGAIQAGRIEDAKKELAEIDRELLRRAESGDTSGQRKVYFIVASTPPGARIEADGKFIGIAPTLMWFTGNPATTATITATPAQLDRPGVGFLQGIKEEDGNLTWDEAAFGTIGFVVPNTPASRMGLLKGDTLLGINGVTLPRNTGSKESAKSLAVAIVEQMTKIGFGAPVTLSIVRDGRMMEVRGTTIDQLEGRYYVQEKRIQPMQLRNGVVMFDLHTQTGTPVVLGADTSHSSSNPTGKTFMGTGFAIADGGYVLTCHHVVEKSSDIEIRDATGVAHSAKVLASDADNDLCLLRAPDLNAKPIPAAPPNSVSVGENVYLLGFPMEGVLENQSPVAGSGVVASLKGLKGDPRHYQVTLPINPGNSGGPVLDPNGRWIAVASHKLNDLYSLGASESVPQGLNFAVKGTLFIPLLDSIPEVKLPAADGTNTFTLQEVSKRFSDSVLLIKAKH